MSAKYFSYFLVLFLLGCNNSAPPIYPEHSKGIVDGSVLPKDSEDSVSQRLVGIGIASRDKRSTIGQCSGTALNDKVILTAAHCFFRKNERKVVDADRVYIVLGNRKTEDPWNMDEVRLVHKIKIHEKYIPKNPNSTYEKEDLAILYLESGIDRNLPEINFLPPEFRLREAQSITLAGVGRTSETINRKRMDFTFKKFEDSRYSRNISKTLVELKGPKHNGIQTGDSGGPAFAEFENTVYFWGVASTVRTTYNDLLTGKVQYTDIREYLPWIESAL